MQLRELVAHLYWLTPFNVGATACATVPAVKVQHFATEALSLDIARMERLAPPKRYTLAAALVMTQVARTLDLVAVYPPRYHGSCLAGLWRFAGARSTASRAETSLTMLCVWVQVELEIPLCISL
jgi:hypothetical protein